ncbi:BRCT domain-containing protein [Chaetomium fimeti]|uniref:BRCT domain-containing protein n=1 Tax=Chaetomium fimeti TaxID=1854472 RepID=A0AAE0HA39_9PEZI|nr:BRCT domain-containing protein [Chaetomium fimeti]
MADGNERPGLLDSCLIAFVQSKSLSSTLISQLSQVVRDHGAEVLEPDRKGMIRIPQATHIISNTVDFDQYAESQAMMIPTVRSDWIKATIARSKVAQVRPFSPDPRMIFSNVVLTCADIPTTDKEAITGAIMALGGMESKDLSRQTTHVCALSLDHPKCIEAKKKNLKCKIVLPHWFDDCFRLGKRIDEGPYLLPNPEILLKAPEDAIKVPPSQQLEGAVSTVPTGPYETEGAEKLVVFAQKKIMLSWDLPINNMLRKTITDKITKGDGEVVEAIEDCDMFVCQYREGDQYVRASQTGKDVGNLAWLYHLMVYNEWTSPFRRLLHYPIPRGGIPGFADMRITLSNYGGEARIYLENLIMAAGATYTRTMKAENTHLITARMHSEKCEAAKDWNIEIVNHFWIEESYAACQALPLGNQRYRHFPPRTNLGEVIGQTSFDEPTLRERYYPGGEEHMDDAAKKKRKINERAQKNALNVGLDRDFSVMQDSSPAPAKSARKARATPALGNFATPAKTRHVRSGKENDTPSVMSSASRSAKAQALSKLQDMAPDIALYEKEKKRMAKDGHGIWGGKRAADQLDKERPDRSSSPASKAEDDLEDEQENKRPAKRAKISLPEIDMRICLTGYKRWVENKTTEEADRRKLRSLGIQIVQENAPCNYLAAPSMVRTMKFLRCLAKGPDVINSSFITACIESGKRPPVKNHLLVDKASEARFGVSIDKAVNRARANRGRLLWGVPIYCTAEIPNGVDAFKNIAEANGGMFKVYRARSGTTIKLATEDEEGDAGPDPVYLLTGASPAERQLWPRFQEMARKGNMEPRIVMADWLLDVAMRQELSFDPKYSMSNRVAE